MVSSQISKLVITSNLNTSPQSNQNKQLTPSSCNTPIPIRISRRVSLAIGVLTLFNQTQTKHASAKEPANNGTSKKKEPANNGIWITEPYLEYPTVSTKIMNEETGTRSFLVKNPVFMADIGAEMCRYRLKHSAFDLLAMKDLVYQGDVWPYIRRYLCLKSTMMYFDFDTVINAAPEEEKPLLLNMANRLFDNAETLLDAVLKKDDELMKSHYANTEIILQEVMTKMDV
ncbi:hypothetical protein LUZ60_005539 [Juncus effusus]|nr:hypothetical protein LUZ60_005539 [Juncus effusus]